MGSGSLSVTGSTSLKQKGGEEAFLHLWLGFTCLTSGVATTVILGILVRREHLVTDVEVRILKNQHKEEDAGKWKPSIMNLPAEAAKSHKAKKVCETQAGPLQGEGCGTADRRS